MRFFNLLFILIFLIVPVILTGQTYTVSGYVIDESTGETLIGANIIVRNTEKGAATDGNGFFRITGLSSGSYVLKVSYIGYEQKKVPVNVGNKSMVLPEIALTPRALDLEEIVVTGERSEVADEKIETSHIQITPRAIQSIPANRSDVFKALKYLPGISGVDPFSPLYSARGGDPGENLVLLDGVTIYNPYHFVSSSGLFNLYAIKNVEMLVGGFGAEYGGRNSSVLYITTREGNNKELHGEVTASTTQTKMIFDFPVGKNATMMVSGRAYYDLVPRFLLNSPNYFYDTNVALNWKLNQRHRLNLRFFYSRDFMDYDFARIRSYYATTFETDIFDDYDVMYKNNWNNRAVTAILRTIISPSIYLQTQISGSFFSSSNSSVIDFEYYDEEEDETIKMLYGTEINNRIRDISGKSVLSIKLNDSNSIKLGGEFNRYYFNNEMSMNNFSQGAVERKPDLFSGFIEDKITIGPFSLRPGLRMSKFSFADRWYKEPRVNGTLDLPQNIKLKCAWGRYYQYIVSINTYEYEISQYLDNYYPLKNREPSASTHYILGLERTLTENFHFSVDFYYKNISRVYTFDTNLSLLEISQFSNKLREGSGKAYGMEILWRGVWNKFSGWISYGYSRAERSYPHIMDGKTYMFDYDRPHSFKAVINHQIHPHLSYSGTLRIMSGVPRTLERAMKSYYYYDPATGETAIQPSYVSDIKNNVRLPVYIRLDLGLKKKIRKGFAAELAEFLGASESYLNVTLGNVLFLHRNVWFYIPMGKKKYYGVGNNYFPEFGMGYTIKF